MRNHTRTAAGWMTLCALAAAMAACERYEDKPAPSNPTPPDARQPAPSRDADNTARNKGDHKDEVKTPMDQGQSASDVRITAEIRKLIIDDKAMSMNAQNCKVITLDGAVTLRGPVESQAEKESIVTKAKSVAGVTSVDDQLEVKAK